MEEEEIPQQEVEVMEEEQTGGRSDGMQHHVRITERLDRKTDGLRGKGDHQRHLLTIGWVLRHVIMLVIQTH